jgi:hypothetical protein
LTAEIPTINSITSVETPRRRRGGPVPAVLRGERDEDRRQILGAALAVYVTNSNLAGNAAASYGFNVSSSGTGAKTYNVGPNGSAIGLMSNTAYSILTLLRQANTDKQNGTFDANAFNTIFDGINQTGDIS